MFESITFDIASKHLHGVLALAVGDFIYVTKFLQQEPPIYKPGQKNIREITRMTGSLGRSEMAMLVSLGSPPPLGASDYKNWNVVNHDTFDAGVKIACKTRHCISLSPIWRCQLMLELVLSMIQKPF